MPLDQAPQIKVAQGPNWELPPIKDIKVRSTQYKARATRNFANPLPSSVDAIEIVVTLASPLPIRAMAPVLWVGGARLTESEAVDKKGMTIRFWSFDPAKLEPGAAITISWMGEGSGKAGTKSEFTYKPPK
jgi:hypothetical protein